RTRQAGDLHWPTGVDEEKQLDELAGNLAAGFAPWLAKNPTLEDVTNLTRNVANRLKELGAVDDAAGALSIKGSLLGQVLRQTAEIVGMEHETFAGGVLEAVKARRTALWRERVKALDWELFDRGVEAYTWLALEESIKAADNMALLSSPPKAVESKRFAEEAVKAQLGKD